MAPFLDAGPVTKFAYVQYREGIYVNPTLIQHPEPTAGHFVLFRDLEDNLYVGGTFSGLGSLKATKQGIQFIHSDWEFVGAGHMVTGGNGQLAFGERLVYYDPVDEAILIRLNSAKDIN